MTPASLWHRKVRATARIGCINLAVLVLLFALIEGAASLLVTARAVFREWGIDEQRHAEHDELLGWVNRPNVNLPDMYGQGISLRTNSQRFRNDRDFALAVPAGRTRVICSGDSYTLAYGVANEAAWCERLVSLDPRLETVNMGQGGYGMDQAYLWYMRDGVKLDHDIHLFAFITYDFERMRSDRFMGYGKPLLGVRNDSLIVTNYPVPRTSAFAHWWVLNAPRLEELRSVRLLRALFRLDRTRPDTKLVGPERERISDLAARIFANLERANRAKGSQLVLVYMPTAVDYHGNNPPADDTDAWRGFVRTEATRLGVPFIDLVEELRRLPRAEGERLWAENGHFTPEGNDYAATLIRKRLDGVLRVRGHPPQ